MSVGFHTVDFAVYPDDQGYLPSPVDADDASPARYEATVRLESAADYASLRALRSRVTHLPAAGYLAGGTVVIEAGAGPKSLTYPTANGAEVTVSAVLISLTPLGHMLHDDWRAQAVFLVLS